MPPRLRKAILITHVTTSVGWLGAALAYIALDVTAVVSTDVERVRSAYLAMDVIISYAIVPLALASVLVGIVNALGTSWGLFRHYWVLVKLLLTLVATTILLLEAQTIRSLAEAAGSGADPHGFPGSLPHSVGGVMVLFLITVLSIYKPRGLTRHGWRKQQDERRRHQEQPTTPVA
ncbi:hypothetical protein FHU33_2526 [Blastococcus colisei]|uniref:DUF2269 domain-containing protein n=1 Tax=Blastococcus colisei TaxID=1564162 RepID=A0A543PG94_9ACTN|nr:hypothetical protein [Blastococcus colisei]TQN43102.1 hypothetical protein FHU33_2526 [Blastococcus colisei]